ncbi:MAG: 50S ribosomal protein L5 [Candidatus Omnitrophica bacterium]|nr:50S ribosomal protein L5 [Candidatus Omnitrophota bacterium]
MPAPAPTTKARPAPRLLERYRKELAPALAKQFHHRNPMAAARLEKIVLNMGCGEAAHDAKILEAAQRDLGLIAGQRPVVTRAKKAISNFKIKEQDPVGCKVTLRRARMYEFLDRLVHIALPRIRDFRGLNPNSLDQGGSYSFGIKEHMIFPEIPPDQVPYTLGMDIVLVTRAATREEAFALLKGFGLPFAVKASKEAE